MRLMIVPGGDTSKKSRIYPKPSEYKLESRIHLKKCEYNIYLHSITQ